MQKVISAINCLLFMRRLREGLKHILAISRSGNGYIQSEKPWTLVKGSAADMYVSHNRKFSNV